MAWKRSQDRVFGAEIGQFCVWTAELAHFASRVGHRSLLIGRQSSKIAHRAILIGHQSSKVAHRALLIGHQSSKVAHRALLIAHRSIKLRDGVKLICDRPARKLGWNIRSLSLSDWMAKMFGILIALINLWALHGNEGCRDAQK